MSKQNQKETLNEVELEMVSGGAQGGIAIGNGGVGVAWSGK